MKSGAEVLVCLYRRTKTRLTGTIFCDNHQMEVQIRNHVFGDVRLARSELEVARLGLHDDLLLHVSIHCISISALKHPNGAMNSPLQLLESGSVVLEYRHRLFIARFEVLRLVAPISFQNCPRKLK